MKLKHVKLVKKAVAIGILVLLIALFSLLGRIQSVSEYFFARGIARGWSYVFGHLTDVADSYSLFGALTILLILSVCGVLVGMIVLWKKRERTKALSLFLRAVIGGLCVVFLYVATAGGCYAREEMPVPKYEGEQLTAEELTSVIRALFADAAKTSATLAYKGDGTSICPYTFREVTDRMIEEYKRLDDDYFPSYTTHAKRAIFSKWMSYDGLSGMTFLPTGEGAINMETPSCYRVVTVAHELAHTKGVMRERDANLISYYLLTTSEIPYFRYCGYMYSLHYLTGVLSVVDAEAYKKVMQEYPARMQKERMQEVAFWNVKSGVLEEIGEFFNDLYLKLSGVKEGTKNYYDPSTYREETEKTEYGEKVVRVVVNYSDTVRVLIKAGLDRQKQGGIG